MLAKFLDAALAEFVRRTLGFVRKTFTCASGRPALSAVIMFFRLREIKGDNDNEGWSLVIVNEELSQS